MSQLIDTNNNPTLESKVAARPITVIVADDHPFVRQGLLYVLQENDSIRVVAEADSGTQAIRLIERHRPDVAVLDVQMPGQSGLEVARWALEHQTATRILILTAFDDSEHIRVALKSGVSGYLLKDTDPDLIVEAVLALARGEQVFDPAIADTMKSLGNEANEPDLLALTKRERDILVELVNGNTDKGIGQNLGISSFTVGSHMTRIFKKLDVTTRTQAIAKVMALGLVDYPTKT